MATITKAQYVNDLNAYLQPLPNASKNADATDVSRAAGAISTANLPASTDTLLVGPEVKGAEVEAYLKEFSKFYSRVRQCDFSLRVQSFNVWGTVFFDGTSYQYTRRCYVDSGLSDATRNLAPAATFNTVQPLEEISLSQYRNILTTLQGTLNSNFTKFYIDFVYCHSNCYANQNTQRVRR